MARLHSNRSNRRDRSSRSGLRFSRGLKILTTLTILATFVLCFPMLFAPYSYCDTPAPGNRDQSIGDRSESLTPNDYSPSDRPAIVHTIRPIYLPRSTKLEIVSDRPLKIKQVRLSKGGVLQIEIFNAATSLPDSVSIDKGILRGIAFETEEDRETGISVLRIYINLTESVIYEVEGTDEGIMVVFQNPMLEQLVSLNINDESLSTVLLMLFMQYGANIVAGSHVSGKVTAHLVDVPLKAALDEILGAEGYGYAEEDGLIRVLTAEQLEAKKATEEEREVKPAPAPALVTESKLFQLRFASVADMRQIIQKLVGPESTILTDERTNSMIVVSSPENIKRVEEVINQLDIETVAAPEWVKGKPQAEEEAPEPRIVKRVFKLSYIDPNQAKAILEPLLSDEGTIEVVEETKKTGTAASGGAGGGMGGAMGGAMAGGGGAMGGGTAGAGMQLGEGVGRGGYIVVSDREEIVKQIGEEITELDKPVPQVEIEAYIVEGTLSDDSELGIDWVAVSEDEDMELSFSRDAGAVLSKGIITAEKFVGILNALSTRSDLRVLSNPRITTLEDQPATFHSGDKIPFSKIVIQEGIQQVETVFEDVGIVLAVTPQVKENDIISLLLATSVSSEAGFTPAGQPRISTRNTQNQVLVKSGDTVAIAGLISEKTSMAISKVPIIGDIPLIGRVFSTEREMKQRSEVTVFITPRIVVHELSDISVSMAD